MSLRPPALVSPLLGALLLAATPAAADVGFSLHAEGAAAHAVGNLKGEQYGWGGAGLLGLELSLGRVVGIELPVGLVGLTAAPPPSPAYMATTASAAFFTTPGIRLRPLAWLESAWARSFWLAGGGGVAITGDKPYPAVSARAGFDVPLGRVSVGPYAGLVQIIDLGQGLSADARVVTAGLHGALDLWSSSLRRSAPPPPEPQAAAPPAPAFEPDEDGVPTAEDLPATVAAPSAPVVAAPERTAIEHRPTFPTDDARLRPSDATAIERVVALTGERSSYEAVVVAGHADDLGSDDHNLRLSERRARAVEEALVRRGVDRARIRVEAFGSTRPLQPGRSPAVRQANRRVEIEIVWRRDQAAAQEEQR